jgi:hypothetical protein
MSDEPAGEGESEAERMPWTFVLLLVAAGLYLLLRLIQGIVWLAHKVG